MVPLLVLEVAVPDEEDVGIYCTFNPRLAGEDVGRRLKALLRVFAHASKAEPTGSTERRDRVSVDDRTSLAGVGEPGRSAAMRPEGENRNHR